MTRNYILHTIEIAGESSKNLEAKAEQQATAEQQQQQHHLDRPPVHLWHQSQRVSSAAYHPHHSRQQRGSETVKPYYSYISDKQARTLINISIPVYNRRHKTSNITIIVIGTACTHERHPRHSRSR